MRYKSKGYVFDDEVTAWLDGLKAMHGSYNKGLRTYLDAVAPSPGASVGKATVEHVRVVQPEVRRDPPARLPVESWRRGPRQKGDKGR